MTEPRLQIADILAMPNQGLDNLSDGELRRLLEPLIPAARRINPEYASTKNDELIAKLNKLMGV